MWRSGSNTGESCEVRDSLTILYVVDNLRMLPICPDLRKLHECHVVPMFGMAMDAGYRAEMGWTDYSNYRSTAYEALRSAAVEYFHKNLGLATEADGHTVLVAQAEKYMMACDYLWVHSCRDQKEQAARVLETLRPAADNLRGVVEKLKLCRMVIEGVEPNQNQIIQAIRGLLPREVAEIVTPQAHIWNEMMDQPNLEKFFSVVHHALVAKAPAVIHTQRQVLGIQQATNNLQAKMEHEEQAATSVMQQFTQGLVAALQRSQPKPESNRPQGYKQKSKIPEWVFERKLCFNCGNKFEKGRSCCKRLVNSQTSRQYSSVVFANASVSHKNQHKEAPVDWLVDLGSQVTGIRADLPMAKNIRWNRPSVKLITASGDALSVEGEAWVTLEFQPVPGKPAVRRRTRLFKIKGLSVEAVLGTDVLLARRRCAVELDDATLHGVMEIGPGEAIPVGMRLDQDEEKLTSSAVRAALKVGQLRKVSTRREISPECPIRISRTPVLVTLEEADVPGVVRLKEGRARVTVCEGLTSEKQKEMWKIIDDHREAFANTMDEVGVAKGRWVNIDVLDKNPVTSGKSRRVPIHHRQALETHIRELERQKIVVRSRSPYCSGIVIVIKPDSSIRLCIDFKDLNAKTTDDGYQLPLAEDQLAVLASSKVFTKLDLFQGYHQLWLAPEARAKTAFNVNGEHYEYKVLPFGLKNAPAAFARFVFEVLGDLQREGRPVAVFFDDIFIGGKSWAEHLELVDEVLRRLVDNNVVVKSSKAQFGMSSIACLGFIVGAEGVQPDPEKVEAIQKFAKPQTQKQLRGFLGLLNFYGWMVPNLQTVLKPLNKATGDEATAKALIWSPKMEEAFEKAKLLFSEQVLTTLPDFSKPFILTTDASEEGLGAVLSQRGNDGRDRPIAFFS